MSFVGELKGKSVWGFYRADGQSVSLYAQALQCFFMKECVLAASLLEITQCASMQITLSMNCSNFACLNNDICNRLRGNFFNKAIIANNKCEVNSSQSTKLTLE